MADKEFDELMKNKFKSYSNKALVEKINKKFARGENDDDEVYELFRRRDAGKLKVKVGYDTYELIE
jgi:hypothetical protein